MEPPLFRSVCAQSESSQGYNRRLVRSSQPLRSLQDEEDAESEINSSEEESDGNEYDEDNESQAATSSDEEDDRGPCTPPVYGYVRCPPSAGLQHQNQATFSSWNFVNDRSPQIRTVRSSDTSSITSSKRSSDSKHLSQAGHGIINAVFSPAVVKGQLASVRKRPSLVTPTKSKAKSESSIPQQKTLKHPSDPSPKQQALRQRRKKSSLDLQTKIPALSDLFKTTPKAKPKSTKSRSSKSCVSCLDDVSEHKISHLACDHDMCHTCLKRLFELSTTDPALMPPKCCDENAIDLKIVHKLKTFDDKFKRLWNAKFAEYSTKRRLYCPKKGCGKWIEPKFIKADPTTGKKYGTCRQCKTEVCKRCHLKKHSGDCDMDQDTKQVLDMAKEKSWQRCYRCKAVVELDSGCNHMTCRCGAQFCMLCGRKWRDQMCQLECPLFSVPPESDEFVEVIEEEDDAEDDVWAMWQDRRRRRLPANNNAIENRERPGSRSPPSAWAAWGRVHQENNAADTDEQLARRLQAAEFDD